MAEESTAERFLGNLKHSKSRKFPDTSSNHWAYEAVSKLNDIYDNNDFMELQHVRILTRYDFARIIFQAMEEGTPVDSRLVMEFVVELEGIVLTDLN